jgi:hypothetical protein
MFVIVFPNDRVGLHDDDVGRVEALQRLVARERDDVCLMSFPLITFVPVAIHRTPAAPPPLPRRRCSSRGI